MFLGIRPEYITNNVIDKIPDDFKFIYELILTNNTVQAFKESIISLEKWTKTRKATLFISLPYLLVEELEEILKDYHLLERDSLI
jgi:hypothetical protein